MPDGKAASDVARPSLTEPISQSLLARFDLFSELCFGDIVNVEQQCRYRRFAAFEHVVERESASNELFLIVRGRVRIVNFSLSGREIIFDERGCGEFFGEVSAVDGRPRLSNVLALEDSLILALGRRAFLDTISSHPSIATRVMQRLAHSVRLSTERIMDLSTLGAHDRIHAELLRQVEGRRTRANTAVIEPIPIHSDIAARVGTTRETVARVLNNLARKGVVERRKRALVIHDVHRLEEMISEVRG